MDEIDKSRFDQFQNYKSIIKSKKTATQLSQCTCHSILIVDDEPVNIFALTLLLKKLDLESESAMNGVECLRKVKEKLSIPNY